MSQDPYLVLGVSRTATDDEIKKAYRELSRKYHPDSYVNNPLSNLAEEKFKEVQEAYDTIMNERQNGGYAGSSSSYTNQSYSGTGELSQVANLINARRFQEAVTILAGINSRTAQWYYFSAIANLGLGNNMIAVEHARTASSMEPGNIEYRNLVNQLSFGGQRYNTTGYGYGRGTDAGDLCCKLWMADCCCECMGGDLCTCM
ncbi:MAG: DnaJ domain-containing protein [Clostridiales bacterium]|nr:DnaJ domain-containing protein [Clostridiales bacterium]